MDVVQLATGHGQITPLRRTAGQHDRVVRGVQHGDVDVVADHGVRAELGSFSDHLLETLVDVALLHLELGDPVAQQAADPIGPFEHEHVVAGARQLLGGRQPGGSRTDHDDPLAGPHGRHLRHDPALFERLVDDLDLDLLDRDRRLVDAEHAGRLARRRTQPTGELREVVGGVQPIDGVVPVLAIDEVVPVGDQVAERAAVVAERDPAVHAASGLQLQLVLGEVLVDLLPVPQSNRNGPVVRQLPLPLQESARFTHFDLRLQWSGLARMGSDPIRSPSPRSSSHHPERMGSDPIRSLAGCFHHSVHRFGFVEAF